MHVIDRRDRARFARLSNICQIWQTVPRVERTMIAGLATGVEEQIVHDFIPPSEPVVEINRSSGNIEDNVVGDISLRCLGLEEKR